MIGRTRKALLIAVLAAGTTLGAITAHAQVSGTFRVDFDTAPHWTTISGTRVAIVGNDERPSYDLFRVNGRYYAYHDGDWYVSDYPTGTYSYMDVQYVPSDLRRLPREYWYSYPSDWTAPDYDRDRSYDNDRDRSTDYDRDRSYDDRTSTTTTFRVGLSRPHWTFVSGTNVEEVSGPYRPDYDVFRYHHVYYVYSNGRWYSARHWGDTFVMIDAAAVPADLMRVPRNHWRNYPADWPSPDYRRHHHHYRRY